MDEPIEIGQLLLGKYRVESVLGEGGMGIVVAARHVDLGKRVAIKKLLPRALEYPGACERFVREARSAARLEGEHIAQVHDTGALEDGTPYILMEYLDGQDLKKVVRARGALPASEAALYVYQACEAVVEAHAQGIVHRDLKPANMMLIRRASGAPCIKVLDFGISKELDPAARVYDLTRSGVIMCSPSYMAPEQVSHPKEVDPRSDIWALGVVLYELVTGILPFHADSGMELLAQVLQKQPQSPVEIVPGLSGDLEGIILKCLDKAREKRFQTVVELMDALRPFVVMEQVPEASRKLPLADVDVSFPERFNPAEQTISDTRTRVVPIRGVGGTVKMPEAIHNETRTQVLPKKRIEKTIKLPETTDGETQTTVIADKRQEHSGPIAAEEEEEYVLPKRQSRGGVVVGAIIMVAVVLVGAAGQVHRSKASARVEKGTTAESTSTAIAGGTTSAQEQPAPQIPPFELNGEPNAQKTGDTSTRPSGTNTKVAEEKPTVGPLIAQSATPAASAAQTPSKPEPRRETGPNTNASADAIASKPSDEDDDVYRDVPTTPKPAAPESQTTGAAPASSSPPTMLRTFDDANP